MENKGLCSTCNADKTCVFPRRFPVLQCEEFNDHVNRKRSAKPRPGNTRSSQDITEAE